MTADGAVDSTDFNGLANHFGPGGYGDAPGQVPEPASWLLIVLGTLGLVTSARQRELAS